MKAQPSFIKDSELNLHVLERPRAMVKRKTDISLDEWMVQGVRSAEATTSRSIATPGKQSNELTKKSGEVVTGPTVAQSAAAELGSELLQLGGDRLQLAREKGDVHEWFWLLLEQCGYERW